MTEAIFVRRKHTHTHNDDQRNRKKSKEAILGTKVAEGQLIVVTILAPGDSCTSIAKENVEKLFRKRNQLRNEENAFHARNQQQLSQVYAKQHSILILN